MFAFAVGKSKGFVQCSRVIPGSLWELAVRVGFEDLSILE